MYKFDRVTFSLNRFVINQNILYSLSFMILMMNQVDKKIGMNVRCHIIIIKYQVLSPLYLVMLFTHFEMIKSSVQNTNVF